MSDLFQPSPLFLFVIFFKTTFYIPLCAFLGLLMCIFSEGRPRHASIIATSLCLIVIITTNTILSPIKSEDFFFFVETLSNLAHGWFLPFFVSFLFFVRTVFKSCFRNITPYSFRSGVHSLVFNIVSIPRLILSLLHSCAFGT